MEQSVRRYRPSRDFRLVYQGGHHNVYCNGTEHIWTRGGGFTEISAPRFDRRGSCDCAQYKADSADEVQK